MSKRILSVFIILTILMSGVSTFAAEVAQAQNKLSETCEKIENKT